MLDKNLAKKLIIENQQMVGRNSHVGWQTINTSSISQAATLRC